MTPSWDEPAPRSAQVARVFVELADVLDPESDLADFYQRVCGHTVELLGISAASLLLLDGPGRVTVAAASCAGAWEVSQAQARYRQGPCFDSLAAGPGMLIGDLRRWKWLKVYAERHGYVRAAAVPVLRGETVLGVMALYDDDKCSLRASSAAVLKQLTALCALVIERQRRMSTQAELLRQLHQAQESRVQIEQAKGVLAGRLDIPPDKAFEHLRRYARARRRRIAEMAAELLGQPG